MEARIVELKGTPEEIAKVLRTVPDLERHGTERELSRSNGREIPEDVMDWMAEWGIRGTQRKAFEAFVHQVLGLDDVQIRITSGREGLTDTAGRIGFVRNGGRRAFAFLHHRGKLFARLAPNIDLSDFPHAVARDIKAKPDTFGVTIYVRTETAVEEAMRLLIRAYEDAT